MISTKKLQNAIGLTLLLGMLLSASLVIIGSCYYLFLHGSETFSSAPFQFQLQTISLKQIWEMAFSLAPLSLIELGLLTLVATQMLRVGLLCWYYIAEKDKWFSLISLFILFVLIYSSFYRR